MLRSPALRRSVLKARVRSVGSIDLPSRVCLSSLSGLLAREGVHLASIGDQSRDWYSRFTVKESSAIVHVVSELNGPVGDLNAGDVWSISISRDYARWRLPIS